MCVSSRHPGGCQEELSSPEVGSLEEESLTAQLEAAWAPHLPPVLAVSHPAVAVALPGPHTPELLQEVLGFVPHMLERIPVLAPQEPQPCIQSEIPLGRSAFRNSLFKNW